MGANINMQHLPLRSVTSGPFHHFFGYYDKAPWNASGRYMLALETEFCDRPPTADDLATICLVDLQNNCQLMPLAKTRAWNWQQGAMLQWLPDAPETRIIYNDRRDGGFVSVIHDIHTGEVKTLPRPVYALSHDGRFALSVNFARLARTRPGYGYAALDDPWAHDPAPQDDGIYRLDLNSGEHSLILSVAQLAALKVRAEMRGAVHWVNHLLFSPGDQRFAFLHRWFCKSAGMRMSRLYTACPDGSDLYLVSDDDMVSHFDWRDDQHILAWARRRGAFDWFNPHHYRRWWRGKGSDFYVLFKDRTQEARLIGKGVLTGDGHCSYSPHRNWILTDTYPGKGGMRTLILFHEQRARRMDIGRFYSPPEMNGDIRCDLHPRWNRDGSEVCIDSAHEGSRQMYVLDVQKIADNVDGLMEWKFNG